MLTNIDECSNIEANIKKLHNENLLLGGLKDEIKKI